MVFANSNYTNLRRGLVMKNLFADSEASSKKREQDRIVNYIKQHVELTNGEQIKKLSLSSLKK
ncbi:hypothetical protein N1496_07195 [Streptococcus didelphis]|uniref:Uncharacterized protein n=1 Tax=Streptococcus didelphis TaxID=102886 RepID=A0ABY9LG04_9STRE|nr:hypothetical protein N1496_07195 [Streptococcus didelphis]